MSYQDEVAKSLAKEEVKKSARLIGTIAKLASKGLINPQTTIRLMGLTAKEQEEWYLNFSFQSLMTKRQIESRMIPEIAAKVDNGEIPFTLAFELCSLSKDSQRFWLNHFYSRTKVLCNTLLAMADSITQWKLINRELYKDVQVFMQVAEVLDFPIKKFEKHVRDTSPRNPQDFVKRWLHENSPLHKPIGPKTLREESGRVLSQILGRESTSESRSDGTDGCG